MIECNQGDVMSISLDEAFRNEMNAARIAWSAGDLDTAFHRLERAHILGQRRLWTHLVTHVWMLGIGWQRRDRREIAGQILRLIATFPAALIGWVPAGNTGGANVSALKPMPLPPEFEAYFVRDNMQRNVILRLMLLGMLAAVATFIVSG